MLIRFKQVFETGLNIHHGVLDTILNQKRWKVQVIRLPENQGISFVKINMVDFYRNNLVILIPGYVLSTISFICEVVSWFKINYKLIKD